MAIVTCNSTSSNIHHYFPPPAGNGDLSALIDMEGLQRPRNYFNLLPAIFRAGRRYDTRCRELIPFGFVTHSAKEPSSWTQTLDTSCGVVSSRCDYADSSTIESETFSSLEQPILAFRKRFRGPYSFQYVLAAPEHERSLPLRLQVMPSTFENGIDLHWRLEGTKPLNGVISLLCDRPAKVSSEGNTFTLSVEDGPASFFLAFSDSLDSANVQAFSLQLKQLIREQGFDGLLASSREAWSKFWSEGYVALPDKLQQEVYETSLYHLRISTTKWSIPVGIFPEHWNGRYFGFDEHFSQMGLLTSGHISTAKHVPDFRYDVLERAKARAFSYFKSDTSDTGARYNWECDEDGEDCTPPGFWLEHIFNMANIALGAWQQYLYSGDGEFLSSKAYEIIMRCADFYLSQSLYEVSGGRLIVGKCTDLERLGAARENAFMTTCGVIATFDAASRSAALLGRDSAKAAKWSEAAKRLRETLPAEDGRYVPYPGCPQRSIAVFTGTFPYRCLPPDDRRQLAALDDFLSQESQYGNMYPVGNSVCVWYAALKGIAFARLGDLERARAAVAQAAGEAQGFSEIFEIANPVHHPWFTTAEGSYAQMVNETLLQSGEGFARVLAQPGDCAFKLPAIGGLSVEAKFRKGVLSSLRVEAKRDYCGRLEMPNGSSKDLKLRAGEFLNI